MREIDLDQPITTMPRHTFLVYGDTRTGKTTWAATFPRPLFLSDATEGGWTSIINMDDDQLFEPGVKPVVWTIELMNDMTTAMTKAEPLIARGAVQTIVIDSISFYSDLYLNYLIGMQSKKDMRAVYGDLGNHLRDLRARLHLQGVNVVWLALAKHPEEATPIGSPMVPGQQATKLAAGCDFIFHSRSYQERRGQELMPLEFELRTRKFGMYIAGSRLGGTANQLPDPLIGTYSDMMAALGYDVDQLRSALPKLNGQARQAPAPQRAQPVAPVQPAAPRSVPARNVAVRRVITPR
jgi:hypothetical protein